MSQIWNVIIKRPIIGPPQPTPGGKEEMSTRLFQQVNTKLVPEQRIIGNTEGIAIMGELASLRKALNNLLFPIRMASNVYRPRSACNNVAHGGQVDADIRVIQFMSPIESERADAWKRVFQAVYGISYDFHEGILCAPSDVIGLEKKIHFVQNVSKIHPSTGPISFYGLGLVANRFLAGEASKPLNLRGR
jgi:hypothetical protein